MSEAVYLKSAEYRGGFKLYLEFNTGEAGEVDLEELILRHQHAAPLRDPAKFAQFYLDSWPTLAWECGFDVAPESLYRRYRETLPAHVENA